MFMIFILSNALYQYVHMPIKQKIPVTDWTVTLCYCYIKLL